MKRALKWRERAKAVLGAKFDLREFHDEVLKNRAMPLVLLERIIDAYVSRSKAA